MKLAFLIYDRPGYSGGPIVNMGRILPRLKAQGHEILVLADAPKTSTTADWLELAHGIPVKRYPASCKGSKKRIRWILQQLGTFDPDVFIPNSFIAGFYAARWVREAGIPTLGYFRSDDPFHRDMIDEFVFGDKKWALSGLACVAENLMQRIEKRNPTGTKLCFLPSGVPLPDVQADQQTSDFRVCYVGRFIEEQKKFRETALVLFRRQLKGASIDLFFS